MKRKSIHQLSAYLVVGIMTTLVNIITYWLVTRLGNVSVLAATVIAWIFAVAFAFVGNKWFVFKSRNVSGSVIVRELASFVSLRIATGAADLIAMGVFVGMLGFPDVAMKVVANILIIVGNYLASKYIVFKKDYHYECNNTHCNN